MKSRSLISMEHIFRRKSAVFTASSVYLQRCSYDGNRVMLRSSLSSSSSSSSVSGGKGEKRSKSSRLVLYSQLAKFRLSSLVVMTSGAGYACYGAAIDPITFSACTIGTALCAGSANAFNQIFERHYDALMKRTHARPIPSGKLPVSEATVVGGAMGVGGVGILYGLTNPMVAALGAGNILLYSGLYTYSKRKTELNTWIGSIVGAVPPVMGWAAASGGNILAADPLMLASMLFLWQFPHFFALSWMHREDYARGGFQMVGVNDPTGSRSSKLISRYSIYLAALPLIATGAGLTSSMFALEGTAANAYLLYTAHKFKQDHSNANARKVFLCSLWYLPLLLAAYVFHSKNWQWNEEDMEQVNQVESDEDKVKIAKAVIAAKQVGKGFCMHEVLANKAGEEGNDNPLCPPVVIKDIKEGKMEVEVGDRNKDNNLASIAARSESSSHCTGNSNVSSTATVTTVETQQK